MNPKLDIRENVSLADFTTLKIGGDARFFARAKSEFDIVSAVAFARARDLKIFVLGGGSNVLISDAGFNGLTLQIALEGVEFDENLVTAQAGVNWDELVKICVEKNLAGIECLSGIPGFVGGTPVQNVGAYGQEVSETITSVRVYDRRRAEFLNLTNKDCKFAYRASIFNRSEKNRFIVTAVTYELRSGGAPKIIYKDLRERFAGKNPTLAATREAVLRIRRAKSMVIDEADANSKSAGSFFKNPLLTGAKFAELSEKLKTKGGADIPFFAAGENLVKIPAAWLIEQSGFHKGFRFGRVGLSTEHALAIVNYDQASAADLLVFKDKIQAEVKRRFGLELTPEPIFVGFTENLQKTIKKSLC